MQRIAAVVALKPAAAAGGGGGGLDLEALRAWAADRLPRYQLPRQLALVPAIPRNAMGKVNKKELRRQLFPAAAAAAAAAK